MHSLCILTLSGPLKVVKMNVGYLTRPSARVSLYSIVEGLRPMSTTLKPTIKSGAVYSRQEAAEALGISLSTLKRLVKNGHLRVSKPAGMRRVFITGESILAMLDNTTVVERGA